MAVRKLATMLIILIICIISERNAFCENYPVYPTEKFLKMTDQEKWDVVIGFLKDYDDLHVQFDKLEDQNKSQEIRINQLLKNNNKYKNVRLGFGVDVEGGVDIKIIPYVILNSSISILLFNRVYLYPKIGIKLYEDVGVNFGVGIGVYF